MKIKIPKKTLLSEHCGHKVDDCKTCQYILDERIAVQIGRKQVITVVEPQMKFYTGTLKTSSYLSKLEWKAMKELWDTEGD